MKLTGAQLRAEATRLSIAGRSAMNVEQLREAVEAEQMRWEQLDTARTPEFKITWTDGDVPCGICGGEHADQDCTDGATRCGICGEVLRQDANEMYIDEVGEFWDEAKDDSVVAHAQCGIDRGMELA